MLSAYSHTSKQVFEVLKTYLKEEQKKEDVTKDAKELKDPTLVDFVSLL